MADPDEQVPVTSRGSVAVVVLAAGQGSRMRSAHPKPLHPVAGLPMAAHVLNAAAAISPDWTIVVVSEATKSLAADLGRSDLISVLQPEPNGTGGALQCGLSEAGEADRVMVLFVDHPLLTGETVSSFLDGGRRAGAHVTVLTCILPEAGAFGRVDRDDDGKGPILRIVEEKDDQSDKRNRPTEINSGMMLFDGPWLRTAITRLTPSPATRELYMTQLIEIAVADRASEDGVWPVAAVSAPVDVAKGVNDRVQLAEADAAMRRSIRRDLMASGVTIVAPETVVIDAGVAIGPDTTLLPGCVIAAGTRIGRGCTIGPNAVLTRATLADDVVVGGSTITDSLLESGVHVGPYAVIRGHSRLEAGARIGTHTEINRSTVGPDVRAGHFSYLGDATIGRGTNIGAGVVTANYDGLDKFQTMIGDDAFIGSDTVLVAPVRIGNRARTGAGAVVTHDVAEGETVVGIPARPFRRAVRDDAGTNAEQDDRHPPGERGAH